MFKRKLFKRALPFILSVAMMFESLPATAMATESSGAEQMTETGEEGGEARSESERKTVETDGSEPESEPVSASEAEAESLPKSEESSGNMSEPESGSEPKSEEKSELESKTAETVESSNADASESSTTENTTEAESGSESEPGSESKSEDEEETVGIEEKEADAEETESTATYATELTLKGLETLADINVDGVKFNHILEGEKESYKFSTEYADPTKCGDFAEELRKYFEVDVDNLSVDKDQLHQTISEKLKFEWKAKATPEAEDYTAAVTGAPKEVGDYELTAILPATDKICEKDITAKVYVKIEKAQIQLDMKEGTNTPLLNIDPGKTVADLKKQITDGYTLQYKNSNLVIDKKAVKSFEVSVHESDAGEDTPLADDVTFSDRKAYFAHINIVMNDEKCYEVEINDSYIVNVDDLEDTIVELVDLDPKSYEKIYDGQPADTSVFKTDVKVYVKDKNTGEKGDELVNSADASAPLAEAGWYRREIFTPDANTPDERKVTDKEVAYTGDRNNDGTDVKYIKLETAPTDAGDYYVIWKYDGDEKNAYKASVSDPVTYTITPAPVAVTIVQDEKALGTLFKEGMDFEDVRKALAKVDYNVYPVKEDGTVDTTATDLKVDNFFGIEYLGDNGNSRVYYRPVFELKWSVAQEKQNGTLTKVEDKDRDWKQFGRDVDGVEHFGPNGQSEIVLKDDDHVYEYKVFFSGYKAAFDKGRYTNPIPVTELSTDSADRNHLAKVDEKTLIATAKTAEMTDAKEAVINTEAIVAEFNGKTNSKETGNGGVETPLVKIYDENALFADRASYKKATVGDKAGASVSGNLNYTWSWASFSTYETWLDQTAEQKEKDPFKDYVKELANHHDGNVNTSTNDQGELISTVDSGIYQLEITYDDPDNEYSAEPVYVYFKVDKQQVVIVPEAQVAQDGQNIENWLTGTAGNAGLDKAYKAYRIPNNDMKEYDAATDKAALEIVLRESKDDEPIKPDINNNDGEWVLYFQVMNKEKATDGKDTDSYVDTKHDVFDHKVGGYSYGVTARYAGKNYTTVDKAASVGGETKHNDRPTEIKFLGDATLYYHIDDKAVQNLTKFYDGNAITLPDGVIKLYSDKEMTKDVTAELLNTGSEYDPAKVNVYWGKGNKYYTTENVVWGGDYTLTLRFKGNDTYKPFGVRSEEDRVNGETYSEWIKFSGNDYKFSIKRIKLTVTPELKAETDLKAGDIVDTLLLKNLVLGGEILDKDKAYFEYKELEKGVLDNYAYIYEADLTGKFVYRERDARDEELPGSTYNIGNQGGYPAFNGYPGYVFQIDDKDAIKNTAAEHLRFGRKYTVKFRDGIGLIDPLADSYEVTGLPASRNIVNRGQGNVQAANNNEQNGVDTTPLTSEYDGSTYSIRPREAVRFYYDGDVVDYVDPDTNERIKLTGNLIAYRIFAPTEFEDAFNNNFIYKEAIREAGGYVIDDWNNVDRNEQSGIQNAHYMTVLFPLTADDKEKTFNITWEDGYTDTFKLVNVELEADLKQAVAPKSISFNTVKKKMAVGDTQQLDVKIKKAQLSDVIKIQYRIAGTENQTSNEFISIDPDTGVVTALHTDKKATTQIEAYPVYLDNKDGKLKPITGKGVKTAKTKITVTNVTAPTIKKIEMRDVVADVKFTDAGDGYRREIYVIEAGSKSAAGKMKPAEFEAKIAELDKQSYKDAGFAVAPVWSSADSDSANYDKKTKLITERVGSYSRFANQPNQLTPGKAYAVYIRNVSAPRTLDDGSKVDLVYNGKVKSFVATKSQIQELKPYFQVNDDNTPVAKSQVKYKVDGYNPDGTEIFVKDGNEYQVPLSAKTAQLSVDGLFWDYEGGNSAAESWDELRYPLPLVKTLQASYENPKLVYGVYDCGLNEIEFDETGKKIVTPQSKYAAINNKGKITLKGVDVDGSKTVNIIVFTADYQKAAQISLTIMSEATSVTGKKAKLYVGQTKPLSEFLQYKNGKKKVANYVSTGIIITDETIAAAEAAGYKIEDRFDKYVDSMFTNGEVYNHWSQQESAKNRHYWYITAVSPNKKAFTLNFTDRSEDGTDITVTKPVTLTSAPIQAVKNLKVAYVDDKNITINFKSAGTPDGYEIALLDARKNVIEKRFVEGNEFSYDVIKKDAKPYLQSYQNWMVGNQIFNAPGAPLVNRGYANFNHDLVYFEKTNTYAYTFNSEKILRLSSYTISVTPVYDNQRPKTVSKKLKTTNIPAARYANVAAVDWTGNTGMDIYYTPKGVPQNNNNNAIDNWGNVSLYVNPYFQGGNVYTLSADVNDDAKNRVTDTLTWKSSDTKVATIKARPGTYTATFRPLKTGTTTITVTSKITKKVISRFTVKVKAVGNGDGFGGEYEAAGDDAFFGTFLAQWDPFYEGRLEVLSAANNLTLKLGAYDRVWVSFTAPTFGLYTFGANNSMIVDADGNPVLDANGNIQFYNITMNVYDAKTSNNVVNNQVYLEAGQKVYLKVEGAEGGEVSLSANSTSFARLTYANDSLDNALAVKANEWVAFTATEDNYYSFANGDPSDSTVLTKNAIIGGLKQNNVDLNNYARGTVKVKVGKDEYTYPTAQIGLKAGETVFIKTTAQGKLWVEYRKADGNKGILTVGKSVEDAIDKDNTQKFVKFTAPKTAKYDFVATYADVENTNNVIKAQLFAANGTSNQLVDKNSFTVSEVNAGREAEEEKKETRKTTTAKVSAYMKKGETVIFSFEPANGEDSFKELEVDKDGNPVMDEDTKEQKFKWISLGFTVSVTSPETPELKLGEELTLPKAAKDEKTGDVTNTTASRLFTIPAAKATAAKYVIEGASAANLKLDSFDNNTGRVITVAGDSFTVNPDGSVVGMTIDGKEIVKAGDIILIEAENSDPDNEKKIKISEVIVKVLEAGKADTVKVKNSDVRSEYWYTFTAPKAAWYDFAVESETDKEGKVTHHTGYIWFGKSLFTANNGQWTKHSVEMKANETIVIKMMVPDKVSSGEKPDDITTEVKVSVSERAQSELKIGENSISELAKGGDVAYYRYTADENNDYIFTWTQDLTKVGKANVQYRVVGRNVNITDDAPVPLGAGDVVEITVTAIDDKASGTLNIAKKNADVIKSGEKVSFNYSAKDVETRPVVKNYIFTAEDRPGQDSQNETTEYSLILTLADKTKTGAPTIKVGDKLTVNADGVGTVQLHKGETVNITLTADVETNGDFVIKPTTPKDAVELKSGDTVKATKGSNGYYSYKVPATGIYDIELTPAADNYISLVYDAQLKAFNSTTRWLKKDDTVYLVVGSGATGDDLHKEQSGTLKITKVAPKEIKAEQEVTVTLAKGQSEYYEFDVPAYGAYSFTNMVPTEDGKNTGDVTVYEMKSNSISYVNVWNGSIKLDKGGNKYLVRLHAYNDNVSFKYTIKQTGITELKLDESKSVTIKNDSTDKTARFGFKVQNVGLYAFQVTVTDGTINYVAPVAKTLDDKADKHAEPTEKGGYYIVREFNRTNDWTELEFNVTPEEAKDATVSVKAVKVEPIELKADAAEVPATINQGECVFAYFVPTARARYNLTTGNDAAVTSYKYETRDEQGNPVEKTGYNAIQDEVLINGASKYGRNSLIKITVPASSEDKSVKLKVTTVTAKEITDSESFKKPAKDVTAVWYQFKAKEDAKYSFALTNGKTKDEEKVTYETGNLTKYREISSYNSENFDIAYGEGAPCEIMKKDDTILIRVQIPSDLEKDADLKLEVTKTAGVAFIETDFNKEFSRKVEFAVEKGETYKVTVASKNNDWPDSITMTYTDEKGDDKEIKLNVGSTETLDATNFKDKTNIAIEIKFNNKASEDAVFYTFVEKVEKPKDETNKQ